MSQSISACLVLHNEERVIQRCLDSVVGAVDEIVVVHDGECADRTLDICRRYTEKVFVRPRLGVADPHRPYCFERATGDWILHMDADESLSPELRGRIRELTCQGDIDLYSFLWPYTDGTRVLSTLGHPYRTCLARRSKLYFFGMPEEPLRTYGQSQQIPVIVEHRPQYNNYTWNRLRSKGLPWTRLLARQIWTDPQEIPCFGVVNRDALTKHLERYDCPY
jgi:hypothetical protein